MNMNPVKPCRKCGTLNPPENTYCRRCGAVLGVATAVVRAQRAPLTPLATGIQYRFVLLGIPMMVGIAAVVTTAAAVLGLGPLEHGAEGMSKGILNLALITAGLFVVSFFPGGMLLSRMTRGAATREATVSSLLAVLLLGVIGSTWTVDLLIAASVALIPSAGAAWLGARLGGSRKRDG